MIEWQNNEINPKKILFCWLFKSKFWIIYVNENENVTPVWFFIWIWALSLVGLHFRMIERVDKYFVWMEDLKDELSWIGWFVSNSMDGKLINFEIMWIYLDSTTFKTTFWRPLLRSQSLITSSWVQTHARTPNFYDVALMKPFWNSNWILF